ncbi:hypothetical protein CPAR01_05904 [Colletotrichum paranaense]|uniref:Uncharacterized protein n=1 Tax=Colletotrichum paranaense TaxID=1914294 RepID=A0ABQ9SSM1_9PEZI|nr:uncharacterized protein CPAR01_05904 [Colletotrichum paranaense]KAK1542517.1 hypothetical protein CPAR01_05904 [Colletotrichum paranaense]
MPGVDGKIVSDHRQQLGIPLRFPWIVDDNTPSPERRCLFGQSGQSNKSTASRLEARRPQCLGAVVHAPAHTARPPFSSVGRLLIPKGPGSSRHIAVSNGTVETRSRLVWTTLVPREKTLSPNGILFLCCHEGRKHGFYNFRMQFKCVLHPPSILIKRPSRFHRLERSNVGPDPGEFGTHSDVPWI